MMVCLILRQGNTFLSAIILNRGNRPTRIHQAYSLRRTWFSYYSGSAWAYHEAYTTGNTTKSSDGTLKAASPVARIVVSQEACQRADIAEDGFDWCGCGTANTEAEGIKISRVDVGVYVLTGSAGLASVTLCRRFGPWRHTFGIQLTESNRKRRTGIIAQELENICPLR
ncbi:phage tail fiber protein [Enterobacter hormaechei]